MLLNYTTKCKMSPARTLLPVGYTDEWFPTLHLRLACETLKNAHTSHPAHTGIPMQGTWYICSQSLKGAFDAKLGKETMKSGIG